MCASGHWKINMPPWTIWTEPESIGDTVPRPPSPPPLKRTCPDSRLGGWGQQSCWGLESAAVGFRRAVRAGCSESVMCDDLSEAAVGSPEPP